MHVIRDDYNWYAVPGGRALNWAVEPYDDDEFGERPYKLNKGPD
jgi:hypothetical protein